MESFLAIDFETANSDRKSACAIGIAESINGTITRSDHYLIKPPEDYGGFDGFNVTLHGITSQKVEKEKDFNHVWAQICASYPVAEFPITCHNAGFDMRVLRDLLNYHELISKDFWFYDTLLFSKMIWPDLSNYKLSTLSKKLSFPHNHHNPESDALACAMVAMNHLQTLKKNTLLEIASSFGLGLGRFQKLDTKRTSEIGLHQVLNHASISKPDFLGPMKTTQEFDLEVLGGFSGLHVVFTGELSSMTRRNATAKVEGLGARVSSSITKNTNMIIVGMSDFANYSNGNKSRKLKDAERLVEAGHDIVIIDEEDFIRMIT